MKQIKLLKFLFLALFITSCSNDDAPVNNPDNESLITEIDPYLFLSRFLPIYGEAMKFTLEYDSNQRLTKKNGGFIDASTSTGFNKMFSNEVYTSFTYANNTVTIENFSTSPIFTVQKETKLITLNSLNQIVTKEIPNTFNARLSKKQNFTYNGNKLVQIVTTYPNIPFDASDPDDYIWSYVENFYYDANGNLTKAEYLEQQNGVNKGKKIIRTFEDYDHSTNPFKKLQLLDDTFYRSLSKNNYRKYTENQYSDDVLSFESTTTWGFNYDSNGQMIFK
ncbi:hypothetical protein J2Y38_002026 [Flavobacterium sp. 2755]|uniref:hypothetical protein n=1 Tax=Flavobacterium sp. 2755 TaxID=2817765 RepID=UPI002865DF2D|nr:hypothetical protein [Flavobacterium sp. 2755]MDR6761817.1 hypothetical protein [Flavobacterium sp. 2755]